jgi:hypothetical protein
MRVKHILHLAVLNALSFLLILIVSFIGVVAFEGVFFHTNLCVLFLVYELSRVRLNFTIINTKLLNSSAVCKFVSPAVVFFGFL